MAIAAAVRTILWVQILLQLVAFIKSGCCRCILSFYWLIRLLPCKKLSINVVLYPFTKWMWLNRMYWIWIKFQYFLIHGKFQSFILGISLAYPTPKMHDLNFEALLALVKQDKHSIGKYKLPWVLCKGAIKMMTQKFCIILGPQNCRIFFTKGNSFLRHFI